MKVVEMFGQFIPVKDSVESLDEAMSKPLAEIKVEGVEVEGLKDARRVTA